MKCSDKVCTGCGACVASCPMQCIKMVEDAEGFLIPKVEIEKCLHCGKCDKVCPANSDSYLNDSFDVYAGQIKDSIKLKNSASGGIGYSFSKKIIEDDGIVVGCAFNHEYVAKHIVVDNLSDLSLIQGSKYVQSDIRDIYSSISEALNNETKVLFIGTPCQVDAVRKMYEQKENLYTIDLVCHGVSSPLLFKKYIAWRHKNIDMSNWHYSFRDKSVSGWGTTCSYNRKKNDKIVKTYLRSDMDPYYYDFLHGKNYRECCYDCKYARKERVGDVTIGDYWGISEQHSGFKDIKKGVSLILVNTLKGELLLNSIKDNVTLEKSTFEKAAKKNGNLSHPVTRPSIRTSYYNINCLDYEKYANRFYRSGHYVISFSKNIFAKIKKILFLKK